MQVNITIDGKTMSVVEWSKVSGAAKPNTIYARLSRQHMAPKEAVFKPTYEPRQCSVSECESGYFARGFCRKHYSKWFTYGDPKAGAEGRGNGHQKHGHTAGGVISSEYGTWFSMNRRCASPKDRAYKYYGGRGISVYPP